MVSGTSRRAFLAGSASLVAIGTAGCVGSSGSSDSAPDPIRIGFVRIVNNMEYRLAVSLLLRSADDEVVLFDTWRVPTMESQDDVVVVEGPWEGIPGEFEATAVAEPIDPPDEELQRSRKTYTLDARDEDCISLAVGLSDLAVGLSDSVGVVVSETSDFPCDPASL